MLSCYQAVLGIIYNVIMLSDIPDCNLECCHVIRYSWVKPTILSCYQGILGIIYNDIMLSGSLGHNLQYFHVFSPDHNLQCYYVMRQLGT